MNLRKLFFVEIAVVIVAVVLVVVFVEIAPFLAASNQTGPAASTLNHRGIVCCLLATVCHLPCVLPVRRGNGLRAIACHASSVPDETRHRPPLLRAHKQKITVHIENASRVTRLKF